MRPIIGVFSATLVITEGPGYLQGALATPFYWAHNASNAPLVVMRHTGSLGNSAKAPKLSASQVIASNIIAAYLQPLIGCPYLVQRDRET